MPSRLPKYFEIVSQSNEEEEEVQMKRKEKHRTEELSKGFRRLKESLPIHPRDSKAAKMSRLDVLRRAIKYIGAMETILD